MIKEIYILVQFYTRVRMEQVKMILIADLEVVFTSFILLPPSKSDILQLEKFCAIKICENTGRIFCNKNSTQIRSINIFFKTLME